MIILNNKNFKSIAEAAFNCFSENYIYEEEAVSTYSNWCYLNARNCLKKILSSLISNGVNIEKELKQLADNNDYILNNGPNFIEKKQSFECKIKLNFLEEYLSENNPELLSDDEVLVEELPFRKRLDIGDPRFYYELWDVNADSIKYLKNNCSVFKNSLNFITSISKVSSITSIEQLVDTYCDNSPSNLFLIKLDEKLETSIFINIGCFFNEAIVLKGKDQNIDRVVPLENIDCWDSAVNLSTLKNKVDYYLTNFENYKNSIKQHIYSN